MSSASRVVRGDDPPTCPICDTLKLSFQCPGCGYTDLPVHSTDSEEDYLLVAAADAQGDGGAL